MARLTVEDCLENVENRYDLVLLASKRTRQLLLGSEALIEDLSDKPTVVALREIASGAVTHENIDELGKPGFDADLSELDVSDIDVSDIAGMETIGFHLPDAKEEVVAEAEEQDEEDGEEQDSFRVQE